MNYLNYLESFCLIAKTGSVSEAAKILGVTQPTLSRQLSLLEQELETQLFTRQQRGVMLTKSGSEFYERLQSIMMQLAELVNDTKTAKSSLAGRLAIGSLTEIGQTLLLPAVIEFQRKHDSVDFTIEYLREYEIVKKLQEDRIDIGIITTSQVAGSSIVTVPFAAESIVMVTSPENRLGEEVNPTLLKQVSFVSYREADPLMQYLLKKISSSLKVSQLKIGLRVNSHRSMIDAVLSHNYWAILPKHSVAEYLQSGQLINVLEDQYIGMVYLAYRKPQLRRKLGRRFINYLTDYTASLGQLNQS